MNDFEKGKDAGERGEPRYTCPYPNGTAAQRDWLNGWNFSYEMAHSSCDFIHRLVKSF